MKIFILTLLFIISFTNIVNANNNDIKKAKLEALKQKIIEKNKKKTESKINITNFQEKTIDIKE
jgi:hypothetical protein